MKSIKRRMLALLIVMMQIFSLMPITTASAEPSGFLYTFNKGDIQQIILNENNGKAYFVVGNNNGQTWKQELTNLSNENIDHLEGTNLTSVDWAMVKYYENGASNNDIILDTTDTDHIVVSWGSIGATSQGTLDNKYDITLIAADTNTEACKKFLITLSKKSNGGSGNNASVIAYDPVSIDSIMDNMLYYGIVTNKWNKIGGDSETSVAAGEIYNPNGGQNGSNDSKSKGSNAQFWMVGSVTGRHLQVKGYHVYLSSPDAVFYGHQIYFDENNEHANSAMITHTTDDNVPQKISVFLTNHATVLSNSYATYNSFPSADSASEVISGSGNKITIDLTGLPDDKTYYFDVNSLGLKGAIAVTQGLVIKKKDGQKLVFNLSGNEDYHIDKYELINQSSKGEKTYYSDNLANMTTADGDVVEDIIFNCIGGGNITVARTAGVFLAPGRNVEATATCGGWVVCDTFTSDDEWHFVYDKVQVNTVSDIKAKKVVLPAGNSIPEGKFSFVLTPIKGTTGTEITNTVSTSGVVEFNLGEHKYTQEGTHIYTYELKEVIPDDAKATIDGVEYTYSSAQGTVETAKIKNANWVDSDGYQYDTKVYTAEVIDIVTKDNTAKKLGSGSIDVYATPAMILLIEDTAQASVAAELEVGQGTVGTELNIKHLAATPVGMRVVCETELVEVDGRRLLFNANVYDEVGKIGEGTHERFIVDCEEFQKKTDEKLKK